MHDRKTVVLQRAYISARRVRSLKLHKCKYDYLAFVNLTKHANVTKNKQPEMNRENKILRAE